jgi:hypothetical protein
LCSGSFCHFNKFNIWDRGVACNAPTIGVPIKVIYNDSIYLNGNGQGFGYFWMLYAKSENMNKMGNTWVIKQGKEAMEKEIPKTQNMD